MSWRALKDEFSIAGLASGDTLPSLAPVANTTSKTGNAIDLANTNGNMIILVPGLWTDGTHTPKLTYCETSAGTYSDVAAADMVGSFSAISSTATAIAQKVSYIGSARFIKPVLTGAGATTGAIVGFQQLLSYRKQPTT